MNQALALAGVRIPVRAKNLNDQLDEFIGCHATLQASDRRLTNLPVPRDYGAGTGISVNQNGAPVT
jgi:hypothetical protein